MPAENQDRRLTFGRQTAQNSVDPNENPMQHLLLDENILDSVDTGLSRLSRALQPRLERYKVELFINLCEMLEDDDFEGEEQQQQM